MPEYRAGDSFLLFAKPERIGKWRIEILAHPNLAFVETQYARSALSMFGKGDEPRLSLLRVLDDDLVAGLRHLK